MRSSNQTAEPQGCRLTERGHRARELAAGVLLGLTIVLALWPGLIRELLVMAAITAAVWLVLGLVVITVGFVLTRGQGGRQ